MFFPSNLEVANYSVAAFQEAPWAVVQTLLIMLEVSKFLLFMLFLYKNGM